MKNKQQFDDFSDFDLNDKLINDVIEKLLKDRNSHSKKSIKPRDLQLGLQIISRTEPYTKDDENV